MSGRRRANRVAEDLALGAAFLAGAVGALAPPSPTGRPLVDSVLVALAIGVTVWGAASAPWWLLVVVAGVAMAASGDALLLAIATGALLLAVWVGVRRRSMPEWRAALVGVSLNVLAWAELGIAFGVSSALAIAAGVVVFVLGVRRRPRAVRRRAWLGAGVAACVAAFGMIAFGLAAAQSRSDLERGQQLAEEGIDLLDTGDFGLAAERFDEASSALRATEDRLAAPWVKVAGFVPVLSQHRVAAERLSAGGSDATAEVAAALRLVDADALTVTGGQIDLAAVTALADPFARVDAALAGLSTEVERSRSPWLLDVVRDELDSLDERLADNQPQLANARLAIDVAPGMLGGNGPRRYLVLLTTPAEARGVGGFPGNYVELTIDAGRVAMSDFGRTSTLEIRAREIGARLAGPPELIERYGEYLIARDGAVGQAPFRNLTMAPNFPWVGEAAAGLYEQVTGRPVDGVMMMDVTVVAELLRYTGPVPLTSVPFVLDADNAEQFLLLGQYSLATDNAERIDALEEAAQSTFGALIAGSVPAPTALAADLGPLAAERRLAVWTKHDAEVDLLRRVGLLGEIPRPDGANGWAFTVSNAGGSKIDTFLERRASFVHTTDEATGRTTATLRIELTNTAPASGLPNYVIGNSRGLPLGTNRLLLSTYTALPVVDATRNGAPFPISPGFEATWNVSSRFINIPPGETVSLQFELAGRLERPDEVVTWTQPLALPLELLE